MLDFKKILIGKIAVYIDAANLERSVSDIGTAPGIKKIPKGYRWKAVPKGSFQKAKIPLTRDSAVDNSLSTAGKVYRDKVKLSIC